MSQTPPPFPPDTFLLDPQNAGILRGERKRPAFHWSGILVVALALMMLVFGGQIMVNTLQQIAVRLQLQFGGVQTQATILGLNSSVTYSRGRPITYYSVQYSFIPSTQNSVQSPVFASAPIPEAAYHRLREGDAISIRYLPNNPDVSSPVNDTIDDSGFDTLLGLVFIGLPLAGMYGLFAIWRENKRLFSQGQLVAGKIHSARGHQVQNKYQVTIGYRFRPRDGHEIEAYQSQTRNDLKPTDLPPKGTPIAVLYVDDNLYRLL